MGPLYFDHNATTPVLPEVLEAMLPYFTEAFGNPSSQHAYGRAARAAVDAARAEVALAIDADPEEIIFTSGGTESNNLAIFGVCAARPYRHHIVTSVVEHPAVREPVTRFERDHSPADVTWLEVDEVGRVRPEQAARAIHDGTLLVTVMHSNNETGTVQPIAALSEAAHAVNALSHTDASQSVGKLPVSVRALGVDLLTLAGHKLYAPKGVGALYVRRGTFITPRVLGAAHERGLRPGTESVPNVVGLGRACTVARRELETERVRILDLTKRLYRVLVSGIEGLALNGAPLEDPARLPNTLSVRFPNVVGQAVLDAAPDVAASTGSACHQGEPEASRGILALGVSAQEALGTVRLSLGRRTDSDAVDQAGSSLIRAYRSVVSR